MKPAHVARERWQVELDHRVAVRAAQALLSKTDLDADGRAELANVIQDFYLDAETKIPSEERTPTTELFEEEHVNDNA